MGPIWLLAHCILGKFLGVVCHCFPPPLDVPTFATTCLCVRSDARDPSSERCPAVILPKFRLPRKFRDLLHAANLRHGTDGFTSLPKEGVMRIFSGGFYPYFKYEGSRLQQSDCNFMWDHLTSRPIIESYFQACRCLYPYAVPAGVWRKLSMVIWGTNPSLSVVDVLREGVFWCQAPPASGTWHAPPRLIYRSLLRLCDACQIRREAI